jgi:hypothetical protein
MFVVGAARRLECPDARPITACKLTHAEVSCVYPHLCRKSLAQSSGSRQDWPINTGIQPRFARHLSQTVSSESVRGRSIPPVCDRPCHLRPWLLSKASTAGCQDSRWYTES